jgi:hypothetical protein
MILYEMLSKAEEYRKFRKNGLPQNKFAELYLLSRKNNPEKKSTPEI